MSPTHALKVITIPGRGRFYVDPRLREYRSTASPHVRISFDAYLDETYTAAVDHATTCRACSMPILDAEGNPGYYAEACRQGFPLLVAYVQALREEVPPPYLKTFERSA